MTVENELELKRFLAHIQELAERSLRDQKPQWTNFLEPPSLEAAEAVLRFVTGVRFNSYGGYPRSERRRLVIYPDYYIVETIEPELAFLEITPTPSLQLSHRDYLGALLALGVKREKIGDLLVDDSKCQAVVTPELADYLRINLGEVGKAKVSVTLIEPERLNLPDRRIKEIRTTVASLRLDALAALGFGDSRTKMAREIKAERVKVNWKTVKAPDLELAPGAVISIRGRGRVEFQEITGTSKKGRVGVVLKRFI
ncbi:MAG TPA: YlmH/Sll1252 family protein [Bacillota bacterium]